MVVSPQFWRGRSVLLTGHTGFKGGWLTFWLHQLGARVHGYAAAPPTDPNLFEVARIRQLLASDTRADLMDLERLRDAFRAAKPEIVLHLAAQPLVRRSYQEPLSTFSINVIGTANILEAARSVESVGAVVVVTTDKVYKSRDNTAAYLEDDPLGGTDPYSASKAAAEIVTSSYRESFFSQPDPHTARIATARAGNVIGGGDWSTDRLIPDCLRAFAANQPVHLRYPHSVRPWQHVLEPLSGYLQLAQLLLSHRGGEFASAWNFGPNASGNITAGDLALIVCRLWGGGVRVVNDESAQNPPEATMLTLDSTHARVQIGWQPRWSVQQAAAHTVAWHRAWIRGDDMAAVTAEQIRQYEESAKV